MTTYERVYDGLEEMIAAADAGVHAGRVCETVMQPNAAVSSIGRRFADWADVKAKIGAPWQEGLDEVQWMLFELRKATLPPVTCQKRRPRFADDGDEVDHDRLGRSGLLANHEPGVGRRAADVLPGRRHGHAGQQGVDGHPLARGGGRRPGRPARSTGAPGRGVGRLPPGRRV